MRGNRGLKMNKRRRRVSERNSRRKKVIRKRRKSGRGKKHDPWTCA